MTPEQIAQTYKASLDSVALINNGKPAYQTDEDWYQTVKANKEHLSLLLEKDYWTNEDLQPLIDAVNLVIPGVPDYNAPTPLVTPNWDGFNLYMLSDPTFKGYRDVVRAVDGDLNSALFDAYGLIVTNGLGAFSLVWQQWVTISGITPADRDAIADTAEALDLPGDFVTAVRG